jgi:hypothetical protein
VTAASEMSVRFGRLERRGVLLGLSAAQVALVAGGVVVLVLAEYGAGASGILITAPLWATLIAVGVVSVGGRPLVSWLPVVGQWLVRRALRRTRWLYQPTRTGPREVITVPGLSRSLELRVSETTGAALLVDRRAGTATAVLEVRGRGFVLAEPGTQERLVAAWGRVLASLGQQSSVVRLQVLHRTVPGGVASVRRWWSANALAGASWASRLMAELIADAEESADRQQCLLAIAVRLPSSGRRRVELVRALDQQCATLAGVVAAAEVDVRGWLRPARLRHVLRSVYDPTGTAIAEVGPAPVAGATSWVSAMGLEEAWDSLRTDSAHHAVYWVQEWPRSDVHPGFLQPLTLSPGARRTFTLLAEPLPVAKAFRDIRRAKVEQAADATQRSRMGRIEDESTRAEAADLIRREQDLVAGHGDLRFVGLVTVSATTAEELVAARRVTETAAAQAMCELRLLVGQQGQAFAAAALPLAQGLL